MKKQNNWIRFLIVIRGGKRDGKMSVVATDVDGATIRLIDVQTRKTSLASSGCCVGSTIPLSLCASGVDVETATEIGTASDVGEGWGVGVVGVGVSDASWRSIVKPDSRKRVPAIFIPSLSFESPYCHRMMLAIALPKERVNALRVFLLNSGRIQAARNCALILA